MEMRLEKNNCNLLRKTRNFYSVTPRLKLSDLDYLLRIEMGLGYSETLRAGLPDKFHFDGKSQDLPKLQVFFGGGGIL